MAFDFSGHFLAIGRSDGSVAVINAVKEWNSLATVSGHKKDITGLCWGPGASYLVSSSLDRYVKVHVPSADH